MRYTTDGRVFSNDEATNKEIQDVLQLNVGYLQTGRSAAITALSRQIGTGTWSDIDIQRELRRLQAGVGTTQLDEYAPVLVYWLEKRLGRR